ncbi:MAG: hypothetical protein ABJ327_19895 [Litoreibacter sp.]
MREPDIGFQQEPNLVAGPVKLSRLAAGCAMEQIDHAPGNILSIGFQSSVGEHREQIGPYAAKRLVDRMFAGKVGLVEGGRPDAEA